MEARDWRQMLTVGKQVLADEARQEQEIVRLVCAHGHGKAGGDLRQPFLIPVGSASVERWSDKDLEE